MNSLIEPPVSLFNSKAMFNPFQYKPFQEVMSWNSLNQKWEHNGKDMFITDEVGVGKTFESGFIIQELIKNNPNLSILIICPVKLCANWEKEMRENFYLSFNDYHKNKVLGQFNIVPYSYFRIYKKKNVEPSIKELIEIENNLQYEKDQLSDLLKEKIHKLHYDVLVIDEVHYVRNKGNLWFGIEELINHNNSLNSLKIFMTATPIFNASADLKNIENLFKNDFKRTTTLQGESNCYDFLLDINNVSTSMNTSESLIWKEITSGYYEENSYGRYWKSKYKSLTGFLKRISTSSLYSLIKFVNRNAHFDNDNEFEELFFNFEDETLKNLCENWDEKHDSKFNNLENLITQLKTEDENNGIMPFKLIIFSCFLDTCSYLKLRLDQYQTYMITGQDNSKDVERTKNNFINTDKNAILICSDAAKEGHNLQVSHYMIHYDFPYTPAALSQRNGRIYRKGQMFQPKIYYMTVKDSYDERLFGEIIVNKTQIVSFASNEKLISAINVLPKDSDKYIQKCLKIYFNHRVEKRRNKTNKKENYEQLEYNYQLNKKGIPILDNYPDDFNSCSDFVRIFSLYNNNEMEKLKDYYELKYTEEQERFNETVFGKEFKNVSFQDACNNYWNKLSIEKHTHYCDFMIDNDSYSISDYKEQFIPLLKINDSDWETENDI